MTPPIFILVFAFAFGDDIRTVEIDYKFMTPDDCQEAGEYFYHQLATSNVAQVVPELDEVWFTCIPRPNGVLS